MAIIIGTKSKDILVGGSANDFIIGDDGADTIIAGAGNDLIFGGKGADFIDGGSGTDLINYGDSTTAVTVNLAAHVGDGGTAEGDILFNIEDVNGSDFGDLLIGDANANTIRGGDGNDVIRSGGGADKLFGDKGNDTLYAENGFVDFDGGIGNDTADFSGYTASPYYYQPPGLYVNLDLGIVEYDGLPNGHGPTGDIVGIENVNGSQFRDLIVGDQKGNILTGNGGDDRLTGWLGNDIFNYDRHNGVVDFGHDDITDFTPGEDRLMVDHGIFANYGVLAQHMKQVGADVVITYDADNSITLHNVTMANLHASDFIIA